MTRIDCISCVFLSGNKSDGLTCCNPFSVYMKIPTSVTCNLSMKESELQEYYKARGVHI